MKKPTDNMVLAAVLASALALVNALTSMLHEVGKILQLLFG